MLIIRLSGKEENLQFESADKDGIHRVFQVIEKEGTLLDTDYNRKEIERMFKYINDNSSHKDPTFPMKTRILYKDYDINESFYAMVKRDVDMKNRFSPLIGPLNPETVFHAGEPISRDTLILNMFDNTRWYADLTEDVAVNLRSLFLFFFLFFFLSQPFSLPERILPQAESPRAFQDCE